MDYYNYLFNFQLRSVETSLGIKSTEAKSVTSRAQSSLKEFKKNNPFLNQTELPELERDCYEKILNDAAEIIKLYIACPNMVASV